MTRRAGRETQQVSQNNVRSKPLRINLSHSPAKLETDFWLFRSRYGTEEKQTRPQPDADRDDDGERRRRGQKRLSCDAGDATQIGKDSPDGGCKQNVGSAHVLGRGRDSDSASPSQKVRVYDLKFVEGIELV